MKWKNRLLGFASGVDEKLDKVRSIIRERFGTSQPLQIVPYRSYGTPEHIYVKGRVLEDKGINKATAKDDILTNLVNMYKRFESDEVPGAKLLLKIGDQYHNAVADHEGYFIFNINLSTPIITKEQYYNLQLKLMPDDDQPAVTSTAEIMIPQADAAYGIISDIDDTIIKTGAANLFEMGKTVLFANARTRLPFEGVSEFYKGLQLGKNGKNNNPFFYVSSSPWNLYDLIKDFMDIHSIPHGPLLLRDFGIRSETFMKGDYLGHKFKEISQILNTYPRLNFILIGDSGEEDPVIYYEVVKHFPGRIISVYIRDVNHPEKKTLAENIASKVSSLNVPMLLTKHSADAAIHAYEQGLIYKETIGDSTKLPDE